MFFLWTWSFIGSQISLVSLTMRNYISDFSGIYKKETGKGNGEELIIDGAKLGSGVMTFLEEEIRERDEKEVIIDDVRIVPGVMIFEGAYDTKKFDQKIVIRNCGEKPAFIRIYPPTSFVFVVKPLVRGSFLSPGLCITRSIKYTHRQYGAIAYCSMPVYVNDNCLDYKLVVRPASSVIIVEPPYLDFGAINAGHTLSVRSLTLKNEGRRNGTFSIDLGRNELELVVEPMKGLVLAKSSLELKVEFLSNRIGQCEQEFWIKCDQPKVVKVVATFIEPTMIPYHPNTSSSFTAIDFPPAYFGTRIIKTLPVRNNSSCAAMFCCMGEVEKTVETFEEARKSIPDFRSFQIWPNDGRITSYESRIFQIVFRPVKHVRVKKGAYYKNYSICLAKILRVDCMDLHKIDFQDEDFEDMIKNQETNMVSYGMQEKNMIQEMQISESSFSMSPHDLESSCGENRQGPEVQMKNFIYVLLYGAGETAQVILTPNDFDLGYIKLNEKTLRVLNVQNVSRILPIIYAYKKGAYVEVEPARGYIAPGKTVELSIKFTPGKNGPFKTTIDFDLLHYDRPQKPNVYVKVGSNSVTASYCVAFEKSMPKSKFNIGITPMCTNEVGFLTGDIKFNDSISKPPVAMLDEERGKFRHDPHLIAFPNDRPMSLRPWKEKIQCKTIFKGLPRIVTGIDEYELSGSKKELKNTNKQYYQSYLNKGARLRKTVSELTDHYLVTDPSKSLFENYKLSKTCAPKTNKELVHPSFLPLTPTEIYKIVVSPRRIKLEKVASFSQFPTSIFINNQNKFAIRIYLKPSIPNSLGFPGGNRVIIKGDESKKIKLIYFAGVKGKHNVTLDVIINECHSYDVTIQVDIVSRYIKLDVYELEFSSNEDYTKYIQLTNPSNISMPFQWQTRSQCFSVDPHEGVVKAKSTISCVVTYTMLPFDFTSSDILLISEDNFVQTIKITVNQEKPNVHLSTTNLVLEHIPLNLTMYENFILYNEGDERVCFKVLEPNPMEGISITPTQGICFSKGFRIFKIVFTMDAMISFKCVVKIEVQRLFNVSFTIAGTVEFPKVVIKPSNLALRKIVVGSFDTLMFLVENHGRAECTVRFNFEDYPEFFVSESFDNSLPQLSETGIKLKSECYKELYLHYLPMDVAPCNFCLPIILNDMLGPPYLSQRDSHLVSSYVRENEAKYLRIKSVKPVKFPEKLPIIKVTTLASFEILNFSSFDLNFSICPRLNDSCDKVQDIVVTNVTCTAVEFCIRTDDLEPPFALMYEDLLTIPLYFVLEPQSSVTIAAKFQPTQPGIYKVSLPIFIRNKLEGNLFNYLKLTGEYVQASITASQSLIFLETVPYKTRSQQVINLQFNYHWHMCRVRASSSEFDLHLIIPDLYTSSADVLSEQREAKISFGSFETRVVDGMIRVLCTCGAECDVRVIGICDNCTMSNHVFQATGIYDLDNVGGTTRSSVEIYPGKHETELVSICSASTRNVSTISEVANSGYKIFVNTTCFPFFPAPADTSYYATYMRQVVKNLENWIFTQGFYCSSFYTIPKGIATCQQLKPEKKKKGGEKKKQETKTDCTLPLLQLLVNILGEQVIKKVKPSMETPTDKEPEKVAYIYSTYYNILEYLTEKRACFPHVQAEYLLEYSQYLILTECVFPHQENANLIRIDTEIKDETTFYLLATQNWVDVLLQTFKVLVLSRVRPSEFKSPTSSRTSSDVFCDIIADSLISIPPVVLNEQQLLEQEIQKNIPNVFNNEEVILLDWLSFHLNRQMETLWPRSNLHDKKISNFDRSLADSLALIAVTTAHCPYLIPYMDKIYLIPEAYEQLIHNATVLVKAWTMINYSFNITPSQIALPNSIQMVMLVTYLYDILPNLSPTQLVRLEAPLAQIVHKDYLIKNENNVTICYKLVFFGNNMDSFSSNTDIIILKAKQSKNLRVNYIAKKMTKASATLVLTGDTKGFKFAKAISFSLEGIPKNLCPSFKITQTIALNTASTISVKIQAPYKEAATYNTHILIDFVTDPKNLPIKEWKDLRKHRKPRVIFMPEVTLVTDAEGVARHTMIISAIVPYDFTDYFFFVNPDGGDFCVQVNIKTKINKQPSTDIRVPLPKHFHLYSCECGADGISHTCPRVIQMEVPNVNAHLLKSFQSMFGTILTESEEAIWDKYIGTEIPICALEWYLKKDIGPHDVLFVCRRSVDFSVVTDNKPITFPKTVTIDPTYANLFTKVPIHINVKEPKQHKFMMVCSEKLEYRHYKLIFEDET